MIARFESVFPSANVLQSLVNWQQPGQIIYLVGGVVRDALLGIDNHDLDLVVTGDVRKLAKKVANELHAAFYMMDLEHQIARIVYTTENGRRYYLDFAAMRGADIHSDLAARDFTVNAMAVDLADLGRLVDPLNGLQDLKDRTLRACSSNAFSDDPVRLLRAVRQSVNLTMRIESATIDGLKAAAPLLRRVSDERLRDEFIRILEGRQVETAVRILDHYDLLRQIVPEVQELKDVQQSAPHILDAWGHTLATLGWLEKLIDLLAKEYQEDKSANLWLGMATVQLGRYRERFATHFERELSPGRNLRGTLFLAGLLHDAGKPRTRSVDGSGRNHFYQHEHLGLEIASQRARALVLSNLEVERIGLLIRHHMRIHQLSAAGGELTRRTIYRLYRDVGDAGIDLCFLTLADTLATYGVTIEPAYWERELSICRQLMDAWFEHHDQIINPARLISGGELMARFKLQPGPLIGEILSEIHEAQAAGQVTSSEEAAALAKAMIDRYIKMEEQPDDGPEAS